MADSRFPDRWLTDRRILRLSPEDFRSFVVANTWSVSNRTDGNVEAADLPIIPSFDSTSVQRLCDAGLWTRTGTTRWRIVDFDTTQTTSAQLAALDRKRVLDRTRQANKRARDNDSDTTRDADPDVTRDITQDVAGLTKARQEQEQGQASRAAPEPWSPEELLASSCSDCGKELTTPVQRTNRRCNRCHVAATAANVTRIGAR